MLALSPTVIGAFVVSIIVQGVALSLLPSSAGFSRPLPTFGLIVAFIAGIGPMARLTALGVPLSVLIPLSLSACQGNPRRISAELLLSLCNTSVMAEQVRYALIDTQGRLAVDKGLFSYRNSTNDLQIRVKCCQ